MNRKLRKIEQKLEIIYENKWQQKPHTVVTVYAQYKDRIFAAVGATVWSDDDVWSDEQGFAIARGRAIKSICHAIKSKRFVLGGQEIPWRQYPCRGVQIIPLPG